MKKCGIICQSCIFIKKLTYKRKLDCFKHKTNLSTLNVSTIGSNAGDGHVHSACAMMVATLSTLNFNFLLKESVPSLRVLNLLVNVSVLYNSTLLQLS